MRTLRALALLPLAVFVAHVLGTEAATSAGVFVLALFLLPSLAISYAGTLIQAVAIDRRRC